MKLSPTQSSPVPCARWAHRLAALHPDDLPPQEQMALKHHLTSCSGCAAVSMAYQQVDARILSLPAVQLSVQQIAQVEALMSDQTAHHPQWKFALHHALQQTEWNTLPSSQTRLMHRSRSILLQIASLLAVAFLIGSALWIFTLMHQPARKTTLAAEHPLPIFATVPPHACLPGPPLPWDSLCKAGLVQAINQTQKLSNGLTLTVKGVYADHTQIFIWFDVTPMPMRNSTYFIGTTLLTQQGVKLPYLAHVHSPYGGIIDGNGQLQWVAPYDASNLPANLPFVSLKLVETVGPLGAPAKATFVFTCLWNF